MVRQIEELRKNGVVIVTGAPADELSKLSPQEVAKALPSTQVHTLDLGYNQIGPAGAVELAKALPTTKLHTLYLYNNQSKNVKYFLLFNDCD